MEKNEIQKAEATQVSPLAHAAELVAANGNMDVGKLKELLELQERYEATQAKKAYTESMAAFKSDPPKIIKDRTVKYNQTTYNHATLANVTSTINRALSQHGLTAAWKTEQAENQVKVACTVTHVLGHSESTSLTAAPDTSGSKNPIQAIGSTVTYLQRYTILAITGLATDEQDDDGAGAYNKPPTVRPPTDEEWEVIAEVCNAMTCPDGMRADAKKVASICFETWQIYPYNMERVGKVVKLLDAMNRPELFVPDTRSQFEIDQDMPGDEDSVPDNEAEATAAEKFGTDIELRYYCTKCDGEFEELKLKGVCPDIDCLSRDIIDRKENKS